MGRSMTKAGASRTLSMESGVHRRASRTGALLEHPDPALARPSFEVDPHDPATVEVAAALVGTMKAKPGCWGLSAPQLGHHGRILCVDVRGHPGATSSAGLVVLANPEILTLGNNIVMREECTSFPHVFADVARASTAIIAGTVPGSGREVIIVADAFEARCLLHEIDHLDGISMLDRIADPATDIHWRRPA